MTGVPLINPPRFTPKRSRAVKTTSVPCPTCKAEVGKPCVNLDGSPSTGATRTSHRVRYRMAVRLENEQREAQ